MKKLFRALALILVHIMIAAAIMWISWCVCEICDDIIPRWSIKSYIGPCISGPAVLICWLRRAAKALEAHKT